MHTKLTLRIDDALVEKAKIEAKRRGKSVSQMVAEFFDSLNNKASAEKKTLPPLTASLIGVLQGHRVSEATYKKHLLEKHL